MSWEIVMSSLRDADRSAKRLHWKVQKVGRGRRWEWEVVEKEERGRLNSYFDLRIRLWRGKGSGFSQINGSSHFAGAGDKVEVESVVNDRSATQDEKKE